MISVTAKAATATLPKAAYPRESVEAGALVVGARARVYLEEKGASWRLKLEPARRCSLEQVRALLGALLDEALSHAVRQKVVAFNRALAAPILARALESGFPNMPHDPLEQLEPQVRADREKDVADLREYAKRWL